MSDDAQHVDLGGYVLGRLTPAERTTFESHLAGCSRCRTELRELGGLPPLLAIASDPYELPPDLRARTLAAVAADAEPESVDDAVPARSPRRRFFVRRLGVALAGAGIAAAAFFVGQRYEARDRGPVEIRATLRAPEGPSATAQARVVKTGIGRVIAFRSDELPILPKGEFYELWFVGPGDTEARPNRISAGTFHPDDEGRSHVTFVAAVDPARYPVLSVTAEPGDGDPRRTGVEVLRSESTLGTLVP